MSQNNNEDYSKYFEVLDAAIAKLILTKTQYIEKPNRVNSVLFRKQLLELKTVLGQSRQDVLKVNKAKTKKPEEVKEVVEEKTEQVVEEKTEQVVEEKTEQVVEVKEEKTEPKVTVEVVKEESPEVSPEVSPEPQPEVQPIVVVDTEKNKRKARIQPNKKPRP
jgi:hypothetical protein